MGDIRLGDLPERNCALHGADRMAVRHGAEALTWGELSDQVLRRAHAMAARGIGEGDRVVLALPNSNAFYEFTFALWKLGATPTVVSHRLPRAELDAIIALAEPAAVIAADPELRTALGALPAEFGHDHPDNAPRASAVSPCWKVMTSGGSTGLPKLIVDHHSSEMPETPLGMGMRHGAVTLNPGPLYHNFPFAMTHIAMTQGNSVVGMEKFDAAEFLRLVEQYKVHWTAMVPTMMDRVAKLPEGIRQAHDVSSLERVWHTAAPMRPTLKQFWIDWLGPEKIWEMYGGTEGYAITQIGGTEWLDHPGSVGKPFGSDVLIRSEDGRALPPGEVGEIYLRPEGVTGDESTYHYVGADPRRLPDGAESLGDFGWVDDDGYVYIADRRTDLILSGGRNIYPAEVEAALLDHPAVAEAIIIGLPDPDLGARVHGIVRLEQDANADEDQLLGFAREKLIGYKLPKTIEFTEERLRDEAGKARRSKLRADRLENGV